MDILLRAIKLPSGEVPRIRGSVNRNLKARKCSEQSPLLSSDRKNLGKEGRMPKETGQASFIGHFVKSKGLLQTPIHVIP
jgi:hypothetical protein